MHGEATVGKNPTWPIEENYTNTQDPNFAEADGQVCGPDRASLGDCSRGMVPIGTCG